MLPQPTTSPRSSVVGSADAAHGEAWRWRDSAPRREPAAAIAAGSQAAASGGLVCAAGPRSRIHVDLLKKTFNLKWI